MLYRLNNTALLIESYRPRCQRYRSNAFTLMQGCQMTTVAAGAAFICHTIHTSFTKQHINSNQFA